MRQRFKRCWEESMKLISVIVPVYKVEKYLEQCVSSIQKQTYINLEIILVDDGSPDNCPELCDKYALKDKRIKVIHQKNGGLSAARNAALDVISGDLVSFIDSDDWIESCMYEEMIKALNEHNADIVCCGGIDTDGIKDYEKCLDCKPTGTTVSGKEAAREILLDKVGSQVVKGLYPAAFWNNIRFPLNRLYEDIPVTYKVFEQAKTVCYIDIPFYKYRLNMQSISYTPNPIKSYHIFLGLKDHYEYSVIHYPDVTVGCCSTAAHYAVSTYFHYCTDGKNALKSVIKDVQQFLKEHKKTISYNQMNKTRAFALKVYYFSIPLFTFLCKAFYITGLQKMLHFDIK